ncbi:MAG TPA: hypothetical protein VFB07_08205 [Vicinamibacterales bacterium]|nr:hypothetical protein [Vicinamibacterales bacterium]
MSEASQVRADLKARTDTIEEAYEFFLAYASQGLPTDANTSHPIRDHLRKFDQALKGIGGFFLDCARQLGAPDLAPYRAFVDVIERDARDAQAAIQLVLAQPAIGSQTIDNLNASIHVRALLTDLFLIEEILTSLSR